MDKKHNSTRIVFTCVLYLLVLNYIRLTRLPCIIVLPEFMYFQNSNCIHGNFDALVCSMKKFFQSLVMDDMKLYKPPV